MIVESQRVRRRRCERNEPLMRKVAKNECRPTWDRPLVQPYEDDVIVQICGSDCAGLNEQ